ncbi:MAG: DUF58 domain-containing protein [Salinirussus sp.]
MRPTRRGIAAIGIAVIAIVLGIVFGPRALNAVAAPLLGAVAFGAIQVWRTDEPTIRLSAVEPGFPGAERTVELEITGSGVFAVNLAWPDGVDAETIDAVITPPATVERTIVLRERGRYRVEPAAIRRRDGLGLVSAPVDAGDTQTLVIFPDVYTGVDAAPLGRLVSGEVLAERQEFDRLREYTPGDPLRDIHWKTSAKRDDFLVTEYEPGDRATAITIAASAEPGAVDAMATAAGTVALLALDAGLMVGLSIPGERVAPASGRSHVTSLLTCLAGATHGEPEDDGEAAVRIAADHRETLIHIEDATYQFAELIHRQQAHAIQEVAVA